jgi:hypothetical protein
MTTVKNGDEVPAVIVQAPGWSAKRFSPEYYRSLSSRRLARSARSVRDIMEGDNGQRPERVADHILYRFFGRIGGPPPEPGSAPP